MTEPWCDQALDDLVKARRGPAWGYHASKEPSIEATSLAILAILAHQPPAGSRALDVAGPAAAWMATLQQEHGALGPAPNLKAPRWPTALALLAWQGLGSYPDHAARARDWLLEARGDNSQDASRTPFDHDPRIPGWPWVEGTQSWLEPTAWAVLALCAIGCQAHQRVLDGRRLVRDRALRPGGWNYGNTRVFGADLRPQPAPTGLALLALAGVDDPMAPHVELGCRYLERVLSGTRAAQSLCLGLLGLAAHGVVLPLAADWLAEARERTSRRAGSAINLAWLLLARGPKALDVLGVPAPGKET